jgi:hypothetical protein
LKEFKLPEQVECLIPDMETRLTLAHADVAMNMKSIDILSMLHQFKVGKTIATGRVTMYLPSYFSRQKPQFWPTNDN